MRTALHAHRFPPRAFPVEPSNRVPPIRLRVQARPWRVLARPSAKADRARGILFVSSGTELDQSMQTGTERTGRPASSNPPVRLTVGHHGRGTAREGMSVPRAAHRRPGTPVALPGASFAARLANPPVHPYGMNPRRCDPHLGFRRRCDPHLGFRRRCDPHRPSPAPTTAPPGIFHRRVIVVPGSGESAVGRFLGALTGRLVRLTCLYSPEGCRHTQIGLARLTFDEKLVIS